MEIFGPTLQGEGRVIGMQTMFVRLGGCDYRCQRCDSLHAVLPSLIKANATQMTADEIYDELVDKSGHCRMVTFSGGNPAMWDIGDLVARLRNTGWQIAVETQGTLWRDWIRYCDFVTVSPKGPGMGERFESQKFALFMTRAQDLRRYSHSNGGLSLKIVLFDQRDIEFAKMIRAEYSFFPPMYLSVGNPWPPEPAKRDAGIEDMISLNDELLLRMKSLWEDVKNEPLLREAIFLPQMHVLLWGNEKGR